MSTDKSKELTKIYAALSHPLRRKIVETMGEKRSIGFNELKGTLNLSIGTLYYHLDVLEDLITQNKDRKYVLTEAGKFALKLLTSDEEKVRTMGIASKKREHPVISSFVREVILGRRLFISLTSNPLRYIPEVLILVGFGAWLFAVTGIEPIMMFYHRPPTWPIPMAIAAEYVASWLAIFGICEILSVVFFRRVGGEMKLLVTTAFSTLPLLILPVVLLLDPALNNGLGISWIWVNVFLLIFQAWILCLITAALGFSKGLKLEKAALISLGLMYINVGILIPLVLHL